MPTPLRSGSVFRLAALLLGFAILSPSQMAFGQEDAEKDADQIDYYQLMRTIVDTFEQIERNYVEGVDSQKLTDAAIRGMLTELDPYSSYIPPEDLARFNQSVEQEFGGIGIQVSVDPANKRLTVMTPLPGTPAYEAGIRAGDIIEEIEGESTEGWNLDQAIKKLKGRVGEAVKLGVRHLGSQEVEQVQVVRETIQVATVLGDSYRPDGSWDFMVDPENKIGYIRLTHFSRRSADELFEALEELKEAGAKGLVLDLRNNPGGLLSQAVAICDMFLDSGRIVSTKGRNSPERVWNAKQAGTYTDIPMAVLVNRYSASASEITSAALQDHERAVVIGERTWGKGSVQNVIELENGNSALKLTTAGYIRPSGRNIHRSPKSKESDEWGVTPNEGYAYRFTAEDIQKYLDYRRDRDVLRNDGPKDSKYVDPHMKLAVKYLLSEITEGQGDDLEDAPAEKSKPEPVPGNAGASLPDRHLTPAEIANRHRHVRVPKAAKL